ncbi:hypothetical protein pipiens_002884 [Culex pipiens pipiens]|uniref:Uncharacterized protein n=1 Tax=Culex pipiens pipiens TaxID=38569 RepID=A0ABD1D6K7_CULPP
MRVTLDDAMLARWHLECLHAARRTRPVPRPSFRIRNSPGAVSVFGNSKYKVVKEETTEKLAPHLISGLGDEVLCQCFSLVAVLDGLVWSWCMQLVSFHVV